MSPSSKVISCNALTLQQAQCLAPACLLSKTGLWPCQSRPKDNTSPHALLLGMCKTPHLQCKHLRKANSNLHTDVGLSNFITEFCCGTLILWQQVCIDNEIAATVDHCKFNTMSLYLYGELGPGATSFRKLPAVRQGDKSMETYCQDYQNAATELGD